MLIDEMLEAFKEGTLGKGETKEWLELHRWQIGNAMDDLSSRHDTWTDLDGIRMDLLIRIYEHFNTLVEYHNYEPDSGRSDQQSSRRKSLGFSGFRTTTPIQYSDYGSAGYSGLD